MEGGAVDRSMLQGEDDEDSGLTDEELQAQIAAIVSYRTILWTILIKFI